MKRFFSEVLAACVVTGALAEAMQGIQWLAKLTGEHIDATFIAAGAICYFLLRISTKDPVFD